MSFSHCIITASLSLYFFRIRFLRLARIIFEYHFRIITAISNIEAIDIITTQNISHYCILLQASFSYFINSHYYFIISIFIVFSVSLIRQVIIIANRFHYWQLLIRLASNITEYFSFIAIEFSTNIRLRSLLDIRLSIATLIVGIDTLYCFSHFLQLSSLILTLADYYHQIINITYYYFHVIDYSQHIIYYYYT